MQIRVQLEEIFAAAIAACMADGGMELDAVPEPALERPRDPENGDWASTVAMRCAKAAHKAPREIAQGIIGHLPENGLIASTEIAGPGFINVRLTPAALQSVIPAVRDAREDYGRSVPAPGTRANVNLEYVSANPTGPMHVGHGRWAALGDATARVMRHAGYTVSEEFYVNDHGVQMDVFGNSIAVRYLQLLGHDVQMPETCYGGGYVADIARQIIDADGDKWVDAPADERLVAFREFGYRAMLENVQATLGRFGTHMDRYFSERSLYVPDENGMTAVDRALEAFRAQGYIFEKDGATWFQSTAFGDTKDRVLIKENGEMTYFMSDCAYHYDKLQRGFDHLIDIWGADHHGYIKRCEAMMEAWGHPGQLEVMLGQLVNLFRDGEAVRMSKRTGEMVTFEELIDEVGVDATRYLMLSRSSDQPIDFDIEAAKKQDASNPVYYVQYAHARICSILRKAAGAGAAGASACEAAAAACAADGEGEAADAGLAEGAAGVDGTTSGDSAAGIDIDALAAGLVPTDVDLSLLVEPAELALCSKMDDFADLVAQAARDRAPFRLTHYAQDLAQAFHQFYTNCRCLDVEPGLCAARMALIDAARIVLALTLSLLGVSAPTKM